MRDAFAQFLRTQAYVTSLRARTRLSICEKTRALVYFDRDRHPTNALCVRRTRITVSICCAERAKRLVVPLPALVLLYIEPLCAAHWTRALYETRIA